MKNFVTLGKSNIQISKIGLGCWQFSEGRALTGRYWPPIDEATTHALVKTSLEGGINFFDTAEAYGWGKSESNLAASLKAAASRDEEVVIATKWYPLFRFAGSIGKTIDKRLEHLEGFSIDLHQIHNSFGSFSSHKKQLDQMTALVKEGKIKTIGISNFSAEQMKWTFEYLAKQNIPLVSNQMPFNLLNREIEQNGVLQTAKELGITIIAYSPLAQGLLTGKFHEEPNLIKQRVGPRKRMKKFSEKGLEKSRQVIMILEKVAENHNVTIAQVALRWLIQFHDEVVVAIPGATKISQAAENAGALNFSLLEEELMQLDKVSRGFSF